MVGLAGSAGIMRATDDFSSCDSIAREQLNFDLRMNHKRARLQSP